MDEAKSLVNMSVAAIFAALFLGAAIGIISICYMMWSYFSRQDSANQRMDYYANLSAYDNQTIGGADALSLLSHADDYDIFVIFLEDNDTTSTKLDAANSVSISSRKYVYYNPEGLGANTKVYPASYANSIPICNNSINATLTFLGPTQRLIDVGGVTNLYGKSKAELINLFTKSTADGLGSLSPAAVDTYAAFKSTLIYANDGTTDVAGIALTRANSHVTDFCRD